MILGAEIGLLVYGIIVLIRGRYSLGKGKTVTGFRARLLGAICLVPIPLAMAAGFVIGFLYPEAQLAGQLKGLIAGIEIAIIIGTVTALVLMAKTFFKEKMASHPDLLLTRIKT
jgi:hypothetical protein